MSVDHQEEVRRHGHSWQQEEPATEQHTSTGFLPTHNEPAQADQGKGKTPKPLSRVWDAWRRKRVGYHVAKGMPRGPARRVARDEAAARAKLALAFGDAVVLSAGISIHKHSNDSAWILIRCKLPGGIPVDFAAESIRYRAPF